MSEAIAEVMQTRTAKVAEIQGYADLTEAAKQERIANVEAWAQGEVQAIQEYEQQKIEKELASSRSAVFNVPVKTTYSDAERSQVWAAFRSAWDEVRLSTPDPMNAREELEDILSQADRTGDEHLAHAVFLRAIDLGVQPVVDSYLSTRPQANKAWERFTRAQEAKNQSQGFEHLFSTAMTGRVFNS
jgi:hypothetical protein